MNRRADITRDASIDSANIQGESATLYRYGPFLVADASIGQLRFEPWGKDFGCHWVASGDAQRISVETPLFDHLGLWPRDASPCGLVILSGASLWHEYLLSIPAPVRRLAAPYGPAQWRILEQLAADPDLARRLDREQSEAASSFFPPSGGGKPPLLAGHIPGHLRQLRSHVPGTASDI